jgi:hypothetical protein
MARPLCDTPLVCHVKISQIRVRGAMFLLVFGILLMSRNAFKRFCNVFKSPWWLIMHLRGFVIYRLIVMDKGLNIEKKNYWKFNKIILTFLGRLGVFWVLLKSPQWVKFSVVDFINVGLFCLLKIQLNYKN